MKMTVMSSAKSASFLGVFSAGIALVIAMATPSAGQQPSPEPPGAQASTVQHVSPTGGIGGRVPLRVGETFYKSTALAVPYSGSGPVLLAGSEDGLSNTAVDDVITIKVKHADGTTATFTHDYSNGCSGIITELPPTDISSKFAAGANTVTVQLRDKCGASLGAHAIWLTD